jgi:hypothetical protein
LVLTIHFQQLDAGKLSIVLHGTKLRGEFHLVHMIGKAKQWLWMKGKDTRAETAQQKRAAIQSKPKDEFARASATNRLRRPLTHVAPPSSLSPPKAVDIPDERSRGTECTFAAAQTPHPHSA